MNAESIRKRGGPEKAAPFRFLTNLALVAGFVFLSGRGSFYEAWGNRGLICCPFSLLRNSKDKIKTVGVARQQLHFLCSDKENQAKESSALRWACLVRKACNINTGCSDRSRVCTSPAEIEALENLFFCEGLQRSFCF